MPAVLTRLQVQRHDRGSEKLVARAQIARVREVRPRMLRHVLSLHAERVAVRVTRAEVRQSQLGIDRRRTPNAAAAGPPHVVVRPRLVPEFVRTGNAVEAPHLGACPRVDSAHPAPRAHVTTRQHDEHHAVGVGGRRRYPQGLIVGGILRKLVRPHCFPGSHVEGGDQTAGAHHEHVAELGGDRQAAPRRRLGQLGHPDEFAGLRVQHSDVAVHQRREDQPIGHRDRRLVRRPRQAGRPRAAKLRDVARGNLPQCRVALVVGRSAVPRPLAPRPRTACGGRRHHGRPVGQGAARPAQQRRSGRPGCVRAVRQHRIDGLGSRHRQRRSTRGDAVRLQDECGHVDVRLVAQRAGVAGRHGAERLEQIEHRPLAPAVLERGARQRRRVRSA